MFGREPAVILGAVQAILALSLSFGLHLSTEQVGGIMAAAAAVLALLVRQQVTPTPSRAGTNNLGEPPQR